MRGKLSFMPLTPLTLGITPADAGKTYFPEPLAIAARDHPRGCGENSFAAVNVSEQAGSPPRMRGKLDALLNSAFRLGITPADAGKTSR